MKQEPQHEYRVRTIWTGNLGQGTRSYKAFRRDYNWEMDGKPIIAGSADPAFGGDGLRHNPEDILVAALSACHMLWFLHLAARNRAIVHEYSDDAHGTMCVTDSGGGHFTQVVLRPTVRIEPPMPVETFTALHDEAHELCFIANSVNFPVLCNPTLVLHDSGRLGRAGQPT